MNPTVDPNSKPPLPPSDAAVAAALAPALADCGPSLEYEPDYLLLMARLAPREDVQYGSFVGSSAAPDWAAIEREALRLLALSQDIALLVCRCRAATRLRQATGLAQGLRQMLEVLQRWPEAVHPQAVIDGLPDRTVRANALAALADRAGMVGDMTGIVLSPGMGQPITLGEIEAAFGLPRQAGLPDAVALAARLEAGAGEEPAGGADGKPLAALAQAAADAAAIDRWAQEQLGDEAPDLQALLRLLAPFAKAFRPPVADLASSPARRLESRAEKPAPRPLSLPPEIPPTHAQPARTRADMRAVLADARSWFEAFEPSSPVPVLLAQAENLIGKPYSQVAQAIPPDLLRQWEAVEAAGRNGSSV